MKAGAKASTSRKVGAKSPKGRKVGAKPFTSAKNTAVKKGAKTTRAAGAPRNVSEFMALALLMETEAAQRYTELAAAMEMHNNIEVADLFFRMAAIETRHAEKIIAQMNWHELPMLPAPEMPLWAAFEAPETAQHDDVHYLMQPYHALELALAGEVRAERFFSRLVRIARTAPVRKAALELRDEEREHVMLVKAWMKKVLEPASDWADDPDPPRTTD